MNSRPPKSVSRLAGLICYVLASFAAGISQPSAPAKALYVGSCDDVERCNKQTLHRFRFRNGVFVDKNIVAEMPTKTGFFPVHNVVIVENRYFVSGTGEVYDVETKTLYDDKTGTLAGIEGHRIYIDQINFLSSIPSFTYSFDLDSKKYDSYPRPNMYSLWGGPISPDGKRALTFDNVAGAFFVMTKKGKSPSNFSSIRASGANKVSCGKPCTVPIVPAVWVDNERFLTQRTNGVIVVFDIVTRKWTDVAKIPFPSDLAVRPAFFSDTAGALYYDADKLYKIDVVNKSYSETQDFGLGHGFVVSGRRDVKLFSFGEKQLASFISRSYRATDGYLAAEFQNQGGVDSNPVEIRVWGKDTRKWTIIRIKFSPRILGWLDE